MYIKISSIVSALLVMIFFSNQASAETVSSPSVNCRASASTNAAVIGTVRRGEKLSIIGRMNGWSQVETNRLPTCWIRSDLVVSDSSYQSSAKAGEYVGGSRSYLATQSRSSSGPAKSSTSKRSTKKKSSARRASQRRNSSYSSSNCPCRGSNVCIGPRGGRYCITSGGNKRYGV